VEKSVMNAAERMNTMELSSRHRDNVYKMLEERDLDLIIIGGGITGAGIALDASIRGLKVALLEMQDFAAGTSSRSTKLVHGGLRYLKQFEIKMVAEVGKERAIVYENGPHVTTPEWMMLPFYKSGTYSPFITNIGLRVYDFLAGVKKAERRKMLNRDQTLQLEPLLKEKELLGSGYYVEYRTDDARLTLEVLKKAVENGALALNHAEVTELRYENGNVTGVQVKDQLSGEVHQVKAKHIVNAAGPWVDTIREMDQSKQGKTLLLTKGVHLVFDKERFPLSQSVYFDTPDGRMMFAIPRDGKTYVGTTDTVYEKDIANPAMTEDDRDYILQSIDFMFPELHLSASDVESSWAGLRPLIHEEGKSPSEISRKDEIFISGSGLISIAGGKLTGYRKMAESVVDKVAERMAQDNVHLKNASTKALPISGGDVGGSKGFRPFVQQKVKEGTDAGVKKEDARFIAEEYGSNAPRLFEMYQQAKGKSSQLEPLTYALLHYSMECEGACKPTDFFIRRTGALFFDIDWVKKVKDAVMEEMKMVLEWTEEQAKIYQAELDQYLHEADHPVDNA
jgi:glycerol-3-phosphate dehydrogenase